MHNATIAMRAALSVDDFFCFSMLMCLSIKKMKNNLGCGCRFSKMEAKQKAVLDWTTPKVPVLLKSSAPLMSFACTNSIGTFRLFSLNFPLVSCHSSVLMLRLSLGTNSPLVKPSKASWLGLKYPSWSPGWGKQMVRLPVKNSWFFQCLQVSLKTSSVGTQAAVAHLTEPLLSCDTSPHTSC